MSPEFALVAALETAPELRDRVTPMQPPKSAAAPFAFYIPSSDSEDECLDGSSGLQHFSATLHLVAGTFRKLQMLSALSKAAVLGMRGAVYRTPEGVEDGGPTGAVLIEYTEMTQSSPDLYEAEVGLYRRVYTVRVDYQTEEVIEEG